MRHAFALMLLLSTTATSCALILGDDFRVDDDGDDGGDADDGDDGGSSGQDPQACKQCIQSAVDQECNAAFAQCESDWYCSGMVLCMGGEDPCTADGCGFSCVPGPACETCYGRPPTYDALIGCLQGVCPGCL